MPYLASMLSDDFSPSEEQKILSSFGRNASVSHNYCEIKGPFVKNGREIFLAYEGESEHWQVFRPSPSPRKDFAPHGDKDQNFSELLERLHGLPAPPLPELPDERTRSEAFVYRGWLLAWYYFPELRRWELGVVKPL